MGKIMNCLKKKEFHFAVSGLFFGLIFLFVIPPFQTPDEANHFFRSYQISQGRLISQKQGRLCGGSIPESLVLTARKVMGNIHFNPENKQNTNDIAKAFHIPLKKNKTIFVGFRNTAIISPVPYIPQVIGISAGKLFNASPLILMYLGRLFNLLFSIIIISISIRIAPVFKNVLLLVALMPMSLHQTASLSPDAATISLAFLMFSLLIKNAYDSNISMDYKNIFYIIIITGLLGFCKSVYFPFAFLYFLIPARNIGKPVRYYCVGSAVVIVAISSFFIWGAITEKLSVIHLYGGMPFGLAKLFIISHPFGYAQMVAHNLIDNLPYYMHGFIGILGWLDTEL
ncbi:MAG: DUF2142 domain-containing protein, partial [Desulfobacteraceae bacterium]|nr:DUF2142 domain-containing protein [Desulfobacteraceae bacterium]